MQSFGKDNLDKICQELQRTGYHINTDQYQKNFSEAYATFKYQVVYDPILDV